MRANPPLQEMSCCRQPCSPPFSWKGEIVRAMEQGGHGKGQPSIRLALAASGEPGRLVTKPGSHSHGEHSRLSSVLYSPGKPV